MGKRVPMRKSGLRGSDRTTSYFACLGVLFLYSLIESEFLVIDGRLTRGQVRGCSLLAPMYHVLRNILSTGLYIGVSCCARNASCQQCVQLPILLLCRLGQVGVLESCAHVSPSPCM